MIKIQTRIFLNFEKTQSNSEATFNDFNLSVT